MDRAAERRIRSFVRRSSRTTRAQRRALAELTERYVIPSGGPVDLDCWFGRSAPLALEIGFGNGAALLDLARQRPAWNCVGIEVYDAGVGALLNAAEAAGLANLGVFHADAIEVLERCLGPHTLDRVHILFPDPWPKARHHKRRLVQAPFVDLLASRMKPGAVLALATDWAPYAGQIREVLDAAAAFEQSGEPIARRETRFEVRGRRRGHEVFDFVYRRLEG